MTIDPDHSVFCGNYSSNPDLPGFLLIYSRVIVMNGLTKYRTLVIGVILACINVSWAITEGLYQIVSALFMTI